MCSYVSMCRRLPDAAKRRRVVKTLINISLHLHFNSISTFTFMIRLLLITTFLNLCSTSFCQQNFLAIKKGNKTIGRYWQGQLFSFQDQNKQWQKGRIVRVDKDSFFIKPEIVYYYLMGTDTVHLFTARYAFSDVYAIPKKGIILHHKNGRFEISREGGHLHFYWVKSGWLFRAAGAGYAALNTINTISDDKFTLKDGRLAAAGGVFLLGVLLKRLYSPVIRIRNQYRLENVQLGLHPAE